MPRNDSEVTLANPEPTLELVLEKPATPLNTRVLVKENPWFKVSTVDRDANITNITDLRNNEVVATIRRRTFLPDKVKLPRRFGGKSVKKNKWMTELESKTGHSSSGWLINSESGKFFWREDSALRMVLTPKNEPDRQLAFVKDEPALTLCVKRSEEESVDEIILAFIILEHRRRMDIKRTEIRNGMATHHSLYI